MVKDHSDSERGNPLPLIYRLTFYDYQQDIFYMHHPTDRIAHTTTVCYTSREALTRTRNSSVCPPWGVDLTTHHVMCGRSTDALIGQWVGLVLKWEVVGDDGQVSRLWFHVSTVTLTALVSTCSHQGTKRGIASGSRSVFWYKIPSRSCYCVSPRSWCGDSSRSCCDV